LAFQESNSRLFGQLTAGHQSPFSLRELSSTDCAPQPFDVLVRARPGAMDNVTSTGPIALQTSWIGT
jgi:hypothetical protein